MNTENLIASGATVIDVRTPEEFAWGNAYGSINIPLHEIPQRVEELKKMEGPLVFCCASGNRSGQACYYLQDFGIECYNGGGWAEVNYILSKAS